MDDYISDYELSMIILRWKKNKKRETGIFLILKICLTIRASMKWRLCGLFNCRLLSFDSPFTDADGENNNKSDN